MGKNVGDLIGEDVEILDDGSVIGTLKYVGDFEQFSNKATEQTGNYMPIKLTGKTGSKMTIKKNGKASEGKTDMNYDPEIILRVPSNKTAFEIEVDGTSVLSLNFTKATLETKD